MPSTGSRKAAKARALASLASISDREEAAINRGISEDPKTMEMTADVFKRVKPGPAAAVQQKKAG
jgi:hypothetical protein